VNQDDVQELNRKVVEAIELEYDIKEGVNPNRKDPPIKANIDLWSYGAKQSFFSGNYTDAFRLYKKCIDYDPTDGRGWLGIARIHWKKRDVDQAERTYKGSDHIS
jgi:tetratricopeptide (TPR) repeat protein